MADRDDILQQYIAKLEAGIPLAELLEQIPEEDRYLRDLLRLTSAIRTAPRPEPDLSLSRNNTVESFIQEQARKQKRQAPVQKRPFLPDWRGWAVPRLGLSGLAATALLILAIAWFTSLNNQIQSVAALTLMDVSGQIEFSTQDGATWQPIRAGTPLLTGQRLRSGPDSTANLQFTDGSQLHLAANSELTIAVLAQRPDEALVVELRQHVGQTRHHVNPLRSASASYVVHTPSGDAEVRGTIFSVAVATDGRAFFAVDEGQVIVTTDGTAVAIAAGHAVGTQVGQAPPSPLRYFRSQGELLRMDRSLWQVDELLVYVTEETVLTGEFALGDWVEITGRILPNGRWQVDSVELAAPSTHQSAFTGVLQAITPRLWLVNSISVEVTEQTERPSDLAVGDLVRVVYTLAADGQRLARQITLLTPAQTERPEIGEQPARPSLSFGPDELEATGCETSYLLTGFLENSGDSPQDAAAEVALGYALLPGTQFVESVTLNPADWESIAAGETVSFNVQVDLGAAWLDAPAETEVKLRLFITAESNRPGHHFTRLTITLVQTCPPRETTPTPSTTATSPTPGVTITPFPTTIPGDCTGVSPHPEGARLSQVYGVPYTEIIGWFCEGFGFGEIDLAYGLSQDTGTAVADIFAMRRQGLGWGEIMQLLGGRPGPPSIPLPTLPSVPGASPTAVPIIPTPPVNLTIPVTPVVPSPTVPPTTPSTTEEPGPPITLPVPSLTPPTPPVSPNTPPTATP
ncbi:MAG: FecR domain-containing protein [Chloroflexi bacterium]|nr:FecR domain-containing protein [Chloroflexota bacterium]